ncbi:hypothetical protein [Carboxylicivirga linearis]|uniref:Uncharacterized protein n=1 Tax=Carboxylicivirga linearis TaxID=1628157 RepID=A0ABS5JRI0_9BACT|nr:hypothetical protein [Carboxylicivirga linearis]MBS2097513.1 hypothetical protein [Carboxylicivirga linearis]
MEQFILSRIEWLTEWFMQLFFDPMYFYQPEVVPAKSEITESVTDNLLYKQRRSFSFRRLKSLLLDIIDILKVRIKRFPDVLLVWKMDFSKLVSWLKHSAYTVEEKIKSTLNKVQSAIDIFWNEISLGF